MTLLVFAGLFVPIMVFGLSVYFFRMSNKNLKLLVAFSGAFLLSLTFNELIPQIYSGLDSQPAVEEQIHSGGHLHNHDHSHDHHAEHGHQEDAGHGHNHGAAGKIGLFILLGFFIQLVLDYLTKGVEHGHLHSQCPDNHGHEHEPHSAAVSFIPVLIGLSLHSFLEGMPLAKGFESSALQNHLLLGIVIHNIPIAIVFMSLLIQNHLSRLMSILLLTVFALSGPAGALAGNILGTHFITDMQMFFKFSMAIVVGIFLHISTTILFESDQNHRFNLIKFAVIVLGALAALLHF